MGVFLGELRSLNACLPTPFAVPEVYLIDDEDGRVISEKHYKPGSTIELRCVVKNFLSEFSGGVVWRKEGRVFSQKDSRRGGGVR